MGDGTMKKMKCSMVAVCAILAGTLVQAGEPSKAATSELPAALRMAGISQDSVVSTTAAHKVRGQLFLGDQFDFSQTKTFDVTGAIASGTTSLLEGFSGTYKYTLTEAPLVNDVPKTITLTVEGQFAGLGGGIGVNNDATDVANFGSLNFAIGGKLFSEDLNFTGGLFNQQFSQTFALLLGP